jgi:hypothetical protein
MEGHSKAWRPSMTDKDKNEPASFGRTIMFGFLFVDPGLSHAR